MSRILCSVATRGRYHTTLPLALMAIVNQTKLPDKLVIFDDNDDAKDLRGEVFYQHFFKICLEKGLDWEVVYAPKKGQHHIHQIANTMGYEWVWRVDDDCIPEPNVLSRLSGYIMDGVGAIGGSILTPQVGAPIPYDIPATGLIDQVDKEPNIQWGYITVPKRVDHLHCSFLYRAGVHDYHLGLSRVAHREETLFTYGLHQKNYMILVVPSANSWHLKNPEGGIRSEDKAEMFYQDEAIFRNLVQFKDKTIVVLDAGMGDHVVFSHVLPHIKNPEVFSCYPEIIPGRSIAEAINLFGNLDQWNIYKKMIDWNWKDSLENAYRKMYL